MRRPQGYAIKTEPGMADVENDTFTCKHCNVVVFVKPRQDPSEMGGFCCACYSHICAGCAAKGVCTPFERQLEEMESRERFVKSMLG